MDLRICLDRCCGVVGVSLNTWLFLNVQRAQLIVAMNVSWMALVKDVWNCNPRTIDCKEVGLGRSGVRDCHVQLLNGHSRRR